MVFAKDLYTLMADIESLALSLDMESNRLLKLDSEFEKGKAEALKQVSDKLLAILAYYS